MYMYSHMYIQSERYLERHLVMFCVCNAYILFKQCKKVYNVTNKYKCCGVGLCVGSSEFLRHLTEMIITKSGN